MKEMVKKEEKEWEEQTSRASMLKLNSERRSNLTKKVAAKETKVRKWFGIFKISKSKLMLKRLRLPNFCPE